MLIPKTLTTFLFFVMAWHVGHSQDGNIQTGQVIDHVFQHNDIDTVDLQTGNLSVHIPILEFKQKGDLRLSYSLTYTGKQHFVTAYSTPTGCYIDFDTGEEICSGDAQYNFWEFGGLNGVPTGVGLIIDQDILQDRVALQMGQEIWAEGSFPIIGTLPIIYEPNGSTHVFMDSRSGGARAIDGSGYKYTTPLPAFPAWSTGVIDRQGVSHGGYMPGTQYSTSYFFERDLYGNQIVGNDNGGLTDSVGRSLPLVDIYPNIGMGSQTSDISNCPGVPSAAYLVSFPGAGTSREVYKLCYSSIAIRTNFATMNYVPGVPDEFVGVKTLLTALVLPNKTVWSFEYNSRDAGDSSTINYGDLTKITMPSGGTVSYSWANAVPCGFQQYNLMFPTPVSRFVHTRTVDSGGNPQTWTYTYNLTGGTTVVTSPDANEGGGHNIETHTFGGPVSFYDPGCPAESKMSVTDSKTGVVLLTKTVDAFDISAGPIYGYPNGSYAIGNAVVKPQQTTTVTDGSATSTTTLAYDSGEALNEPLFYQSGYLLPTDMIAHLGNTKSTAITDGNNNVIRNVSTTMAWETDHTLYDWNRLDSPKSVTALDGVKVVAKTTYSYDTDPESASPFPCIIGSVAGTLCSTRRWNSSGLDAISYLQVNSTGNEIASSDPNGNVLITTLDSSGVFPSSVAGPTTNGITHKRWTTYDGNTGELASATDENGTAAGDPGHTTTYSYDILHRLTAITLPPGGGTETLCYTDSGGPTCSAAGGPPYKVLSSRALDATRDVLKATLFDGTGRIVQVQQLSDPTGTVYSDVTYDGQGRVSGMSNPYRSGNTVDWRTLTYDGLNRKRVATNTDSSLRSWLYSGNTAKETDESRTRSWSRTTDALGRLTEVIEPSGVATTYEYNALSNLTSVVQNGLSGEAPRVRSFNYDSMSRLLWASNSETGLTCYGKSDGTQLRCQSNGYDANGNLLYKTDARGVQTWYSYDGLNRLIEKSAPGMDELFVYDLAVVGTFTSSNQVGRLVAFANPSGGTSTQFAYDAMGRVIRQGNTLLNGCCDQNANPITAAYDLAGNLTDLVYPDTRHIHQTFDSAGRLGRPGYSAVQDVGNSQQFLKSVTYLPDSSPNVLTYGNGVVETLQKNNRLQILNMTVSSPFAGTSGQTFLSHHYGYGAATANDGNIQQIGDLLQPTRTQDFTYDSLNRIRSFSVGGILRQQFNYDSFGNVANPMAEYSPLYDSANRVMSYSANVTAPANLAPVVPSYDLAGNQTTDQDPYGLTRQYVYDAENRIRTIATLENPPFASYIYGADGQRARKDHLADNTWTEYIYFNGFPLAEKDQDGTWTDYIYANGSKVARVEQKVPLFHMYGSNPQSGVECATILGLSLNYPVSTGDRLSWREYKHNAIGGMQQVFDHGGNAWQASDTDGNTVNQDFRQDQWVTRTVLLSPYAGQVLQYLSPLKDVLTPAGSWDIWYADVAIYSANGTVTEVMGSDGRASAQTIAGCQGPSNGGGAELQAVGTAPAIPGSGVDTHFYLGDHLGTSQLEFASGGYPVWQGEFAPFGQELDTQTTANQYKFTGKERDTESGLDYFGRRYYGSSMGRFMSPDPHNPVLIRQGMIAGGLPEEAANSSFLGFIENPQNWNEYSYVRNNPLGFTDPTGAFPAPGDGHHLLVERGNISNPLAKDFANSVKTGGPNPASNTWSNASGHPAYNNAVNELENELEQTQGDSNTWSLSQWKDFATKILNSDEPAIKEFLDQIETELPGSRATLGAAIAAYQPTKAVVARTYAWAVGAGVSAAFQDLFSDFMFCFTCNMTHYKVTSKIIPIT